MSETIWECRSWFTRVTTITVEWFKSRAEAEAAELVAIRAEKPRHNKQGVPRVGP